LERLASSDDPAVRTVSPAELAVGAQLATVVYRIVQEALTNVVRHAAAQHVSVRLEQRSDELHVEIVDDGRGITDEELEATGSIGLRSMEERAELVGGNVVVSAVESGGTRVQARIPLG